jgi:hypothetical protein
MWELNTFYTEDELVLQFRPLPSYGLEVTCRRVISEEGPITSRKSCETTMDREMAIFKKWWDESNFMDIKIKYLFFIHKYDHCHYMVHTIERHYTTADLIKKYQFKNPVEKGRYAMLLADNFLF